MQKCSLCFNFLDSSEEADEDHEDEEEEEEEDDDEEEEDGEEFNQKRYELRQRKAAVPYQVPLQGEEERLPGISSFTFRTEMKMSA